MVRYKSKEVLKIFFLWTTSWENYLRYRQKYEHTLVCKADTKEMLKQTPPHSISVILCTNILKCNEHVFIFADKQRQKYGKELQKRENYWPSTTFKEP